MGRVRCQLFSKHLPILPDKLAESFLAMAVVQHLSTPGRLWRCAGAAGDDVVVFGRHSRLPFQPLHAIEWGFKDFF